MADETTTDVPENGAVSEEFLKELAEQGVTLDGMKIATGGQPLVMQNEARATQWRYFIDVPGAKGLYKDDEKLQVLTEEMKRTYFADRKERIKFLKYVNDCIALSVPLDNAIRYLVSSVSEGRASINDAITLATHYNFTQRQFNYGNGNNPNKGSNRPNIT